MKVLFVSTNRFPNGDAGAIREEALVKCFQHNGFEGVVVGLGKTTNFEKRRYEGIAYYSLRSNNKSVMARILNRILFPCRARNIIKKEKPNIIVVSNVASFVLNRIKKYSQKNGVMTIVNCVEWYSEEEFGWGKFSPFFVDNNRINEAIIDDTVRVISISSFLHNYFMDKGILSTRIPAIMDVDKISYTIKGQSDKYIFVYAGTPGKKDKLKEIFEAIFMLNNNDRNKIEFRVIGVTIQQLVNKCGLDKGILDKLSEVINVVGHLSHEEVLSNYIDADFSVLLRDATKRFAKAGFPTKFAESMASATPVICNLSSDIDKYLLDGENGFVCDSYDASSVAHTLKRAINTSKEKLERMKMKARQTAEIYFDYKKYGEQLREVL